MRSREDTHLKFRGHYSSHVVLHTMRVCAQEKWINAKQKSTKEQSGKKLRRLSSETAPKIEQLRNVERIKTLLAKNVKLLFLC